MYACMDAWMYICIYIYTYTYRVKCLGETVAATYLWIACFEEMLRGTVLIPFILFRNTDCYGAHARRYLALPCTVPCCTGAFPGL